MSATDLDLRNARSRASRIRQGMRNYLAVLVEVAEAYRCGDWITLGYPTWEDYLNGELGAERVRLPQEQRDKALVELRLAGMSLRTAADAAGISHTEARRGIERATGGTNVPLVDLDDEADPPPAPTPTKPAAEPRPAPQPPREEPEPPAEAEPVAATPEVDGAAVVRVLVENDEEAKAREFMKNFNAALHRAGLVYTFDTARLAALAEPGVIQSMEHHEQLMGSFLAEVKRLRGRPLRVVGGTG